MWITKQLTVAIDLGKKYYGVIAIIDCLVTHFLQNIYSYVKQKKEIHKGLEQLEGE